MDELRLILTDQPESDQIHALDEGLYEYNVSQTHIADGKLLGIFLQDANGKVRAGLYGYTWGGCLDVKMLWVAESVRRKGYGTQLLQMAEREALQRGCYLAVLDTYAFQAPEFYKKLGYEVYAEIEDYATRSKKYFLKKSLRPA